MWNKTSQVVPVVDKGMLRILRFDLGDLEVVQNDSVLGNVSFNGQGIFLVPDKGGAVDTFEVRDKSGTTAVLGSPFSVRYGGWSAEVDSVNAGIVKGYARDELDDARDVAVVAYSGSHVLAFATARAAEGGRFLLILPENVMMSEDSHIVSVGIVGSDCSVTNKALHVGGRRPVSPFSFTRIVPRPLTVAIKISTPNLKVAEQWGDYHFANSLKVSFEKIGLAVTVDTNDVWNDPIRTSDVVVVLRGRHGYKPDPSKINILWLISHPDRTPDAEFETYDHVFVASNVYAKTLMDRGLRNVSVLHQATDHRYFHPMPVKRNNQCLFVGNSRGEYRTMIRWCIEKNLNVELHGGGWEGVVDPDLVKSENIPNAQLASSYASSMLLLNDHWDSMRDNGFPSNRLFDGSAVGTPIITDPVGGLAEVFGDTVTVVGSADELEAAVKDCMENPEPYRSRAAHAATLVLEKHTFDARALTIYSMIEELELRSKSRV